ncbi:hypothetical protein KJ554_10800 [bacterium]|nr:hypothetical protein [bacterium]
MNDNTETRQRRSPPSHPGATAALAGSLCALLCLCGQALGQGQVRAMGMSGAYTAASRGLDAVDWNPANLALDVEDGLSLGIASVSLDLNNNAFSLARYNEISGAVLTEADKQELLDDIPAEGFILDANVRASALGVSTGPLALTFQGIAGGTGTLDKDFFDLILMGNEIGQSFSFEDTDGEAYAVGAATLSVATPLLTRRTYRLSAGVNARYLYGLYDFTVEEAGGGITADMEGVRGEATAAVLMSRGGSGYAVDAGLALQVPRGWTVGLAMSNVASRLTWDEDVERRVWSAKGDSVTATSGDMDAHITESDTTYAAAAYARTLPAVVRLGASNTLGSFLLGCDLSRGVAKRAGVSDKLALDIGVEWRLASWLQPRLGLGFGGEVRRAAAGLGLNLGAVRWDLAVANRGQFFPNNTKGLAFASGLALDF